MKCQIVFFEKINKKKNKIKLSSAKFVHSVLKVIIRRLQTSQHSSRKIVTSFDTCLITSNKHILCGYSLESPFQCNSNDYQHHMLSSRNKKNILPEYPFSTLKCHLKL